jgi:uroporphyrinogen-III decarboxylase
MRMPYGGWFFDPIPQQTAEDYDTLTPKAEWNLIDDLTDELLRSQENRARELYASTDRALVAEPPVFAPVGLGGLYYWAIQMRRHPEYCREYMMRAAEATTRCYEQYLQAVGDYIDVLIINLADFGSQEREFFRPELFAEFYVPAWKLVSDSVHRFPHVKTWIHCCGSVPALMPCFIDAGVDCLNPVQWTARGMDLRWLKENYGQQIVFWGGAISTQRTFPFGTAEQVASEAKEVLDIMTPGGGYVANQIHNILPEVPVENIIALYRTACSYRYPSISEAFGG